MFSSDLAQVKSRFPLLHSAWDRQPCHRDSAWSLVWHSPSPGAQWQPREPQQSAWGTLGSGAELQAEQGQSHTGRMLMPTYNSHWNTWKWVTPRNTWARRTEKKPTSAYFFMCGINYGQFKFFILSTQYRVGKPFCLWASKFSGAFL